METPPSSLTNSDQNLDFEKYKYRVELIKWLIGSVALVLISTIIDWGFRDRAAGLNEIKEYDKYATDLIILNNDPVKKRMLAQFFSKVTPSAKLRSGWEEYYKEVNFEYQNFILNDSLAKVRLAALNKDKSAKTDSVKINEIEKLNNQIEENTRIINEPLVLPNAAINPVVYIQIANETSRGLASQLSIKIDQLGYKIPGIELVKNPTTLSGNEIRYFRESDKVFAQALKALLEAEKIKVTIKDILAYADKTKEGTIELWLK